MKSDRWLDQTGLNLIRIMIGSYFMAISLGLIEGIDDSALFASFLPDKIAALVGAILLFVLSAAFMAGVFLRFFALTLAIFVLSSSIAGNFLQLGNGTVSPFWRDLTLVCAVLLCYASLRRREVRYAALILRRRAIRIGHAKTHAVTPHRVQMRNRLAPRRPEQGGKTILRPLNAPTGPIGCPDASAAKAAGPDCLVREGDDLSDGDGEIDNLFVNL